MSGDDGYNVIQFGYNGWTTHRYGAYYPPPKPLAPEQHGFLYDPADWIVTHPLGLALILIAATALLAAVAWWSAGRSLARDAASARQAASDDAWERLYAVRRMRARDRAPARRRVGV